MSLEEKYKTTFDIELNGNKSVVYVGGKIDRVDRVNGKIRVLDYKTGYVKSIVFKQVEELFQKDVKEPKKEILQAMIYTWILSAQSSETAFQPVIYSLRSLFRENFNPDIRWDKHDFTFSELKEDFESEICIAGNLFFSQYICANTTFRTLQVLCIQNDLPAVLIRNLINHNKI